MTKNALIIDDSATMRKIIMRGIRPAGINHAEFQAAGDEDPGLEADVDTASDLILSDVEMPNIDDLDNAQAMTETLDSPPPVEIITTEGTENVANEAMGRGANGYLRKPFTPESTQEGLGPFHT